MGKQYRVIDVHAHVFRTRVHGWQGRVIYERVDKGGTPDELLRYMSEAGITAAWMKAGWPSLAMMQGMESRLPKNIPVEEMGHHRERIKRTVRERLERHNEWFCEAANQSAGRLAAFVGIEPTWGSEWMVEEIGRRFGQGAKGVTIASTWARFYPSDPIMWPAYRKLEELGMVILAHCGGVDILGATVEKEDFAFPIHWDKVLSEFPRLRVVLAHTGYLYAAWEPELFQQRIAIAKRHKNAYFDLANPFEEGYSKVDEDLLRQIGVERLLWGSDWHTHRAILSLESLKRSGFSEEEKQAILGDNALRLVQM